MLLLQKSIHATTLAALAATLVAVTSANQQSFGAAPAKERPELARLLRHGQLGFDKVVFIRRRAINPTHVYTYHCEGLHAGGGLFLRDLKTGTDQRIVDSTDGVILDLDLSPNGRTILFSWKRSMDQPFHVFTIDVDGGGLKQLTSGPAHNFNACWLPDGGIAFLSTRVSRFAYCWSSPAGILHRMQPDGSDVVQLSANYLNDFTPSVLNDGSIIYSRWEYVDRPAIPIQSLWTINPNGTSLRVFFGNRVLSPATFMEPRAIPGSRNVLCVLTAHNGPCRGAIGILDPTRGVNAQQAIVNLTPEIDIGEVDQGAGNRVRGPYQSPMPIDEQFFLVTCSGNTQIRDYAGNSYANVIAIEDGLGSFAAMPVRSRQMPKVHGGRISASGESTSDRELAWATLLLQDVYNGLEPKITRGSIKTIRVVEEIPKPVSVSPSQRLFGFQFPVVSCGATYAPKRVWGDAQVAEDGSAYFRVPANKPIYFMAIDEEGRAVQRMRSFTHLMPGEVQGCIGCHEDRNNAPAPQRPLAASYSPQELRPPEWGLTGFSYPEIVQPVLDQHCVGCHGAIDPDGGLDLSGDKTELFNVSYENLARRGTPAENPRRSGASTREFNNPYTNWISTYNGCEDNILVVEPRSWGSPVSKLAEVVATGHKDDHGKPRIGLSANERRRIYAWIDLNVPYYPTSGSHNIARVGCRMIYPPQLDQTLAEVAQRRCASCHRGKNIPREFYTRITEPQNNSFLLAPLAKTAGGSERCGKPVFADTGDPDYQNILRTFDDVDKEIERVPRWDINPRGVKPPVSACLDQCKQ